MPACQDLYYTTVGFVVGTFVLFLLIVGAAVGLYLWAYKPWESKEETEEEKSAKLTAEVNAKLAENPKLAEKLAEKEKGDKIKQNKEEDIKAKKDIEAAK